MAPETINLLPSTSKVDMWALGIILYMLVSSKHPFQSNDELEMKKFIKEN
jgi:serine/threonine protein kinase